MSPEQRFEAWRLTRKRDSLWYSNRGLQETQDAFIAGAKDMQERAVTVCEKDRGNWDKWGAEYRGQREIAADVLAEEIRALPTEPPTQGENDE